MPACAVVCVSGAVFWRTAYPTITWWDSSSYSLAAATLGITSSPGSLLLTLYGWLMTRLPIGLTSARVLALSAGALAAVTVWLVYLATLRLLRLTDDLAVGDRTLASAIGAALGALTFAFTATLWEHATKFTPYILSAAFTALILVVMLRWWETADDPDGWRWLGVLALLFGLDFSVHRTNALLLPAVLAWILVRHPATLLRPRSWLVAVGGLTAGFAVQLLVMPIAATTQSPLNMFEPATWRRFWDYVSLAQSGGGFLVELWPRKAPFWSVQAADFLRAARDSFLHSASPVSVLGWLPGIAGVLGLVALWRRNQRLGVAITLVLVLHGAMTVLYFNIPENYFRSLHRHYLPVFVTAAIPVAYGLGLATGRLARVAASVRRPGLASLGATFVVMLVAVVPGAQLVGNWTANDASRRWFTRDFAVNALEPLPLNAIYFTVGDNDTFPVMFVQAVEGVRPDVRIVNLSLANTSWYIDQIARRDSTFPVRSSNAIPRDSASTDSVVIPVTAPPESFGLAPLTAVPDAIRVRPSPRFGSTMLLADWALLDIVRKNAWRAPLAVAITAGSDGLAWLGPYSRLDGLFWRIVPVDQPTPKATVLRANLLERAELRGYSDRTVQLDDVTRIMGSQYLTALETLLDAEVAAGAVDRCREAAATLLAKLPPDRLGLPAGTVNEIESRCQRPTGVSR